MTRSLVVLAIHCSNVSLLHCTALRIQSLWRGHRTRKQYLKELLNRNPVRKREYYANKLHTLNDKLIKHQHAQDRVVDQLLADTEYNLQRARLSFLDEAKWQDIFKKTMERQYDHCPICMCSLMENTKPCVITSCTHCFHSQCLLSFELFNESLTGTSTKSRSKIVCPACRSPYMKRDLNDFIN